MMLVLAITVCVILVLWAGFTWTLLAAASTHDRLQVSPGRRLVRRGRDLRRREPVGAPHR